MLRWRQSPDTSHATLQYIPARSLSGLPSSDGHERLLQGVRICTMQEILWYDPRIFASGRYVCSGLSSTSGFPDGSRASFCFRRAILILTKNSQVCQLRCPKVQTASATPEMAVVRPRG